MGTRRTFSREFKLEAVNLVRARGVSVAPNNSVNWNQIRCADVETFELMEQRMTILEGIAREGQAVLRAGLRPMLKPRSASPDG